MSISTVTVIVPAQGLGPAADISSIVGQKTVQLSGTFEGNYDLLGTQDDVRYVALAAFNAGGPEGVKVVVDGSIKSVRLRANVTDAVGVTCSVSGTLGAGENKFGTIAWLGTGSSGLTPIVDTSTFIPPTGSEVDTCFLCSGDFEGAISVLGSADGAEFNPVGEFRVARRPEGSPADVELSPLQVAAKLRYYRLLVNAVVSGPVTVTMGGRVPVSGGSSGTPTQIFISDNAGGAFQILGSPVASPWEPPPSRQATAARLPARSPCRWGPGARPPDRTASWQVSGAQDRASPP